MSYIEREAVNALIKAECSPKVAAYLIDAVATIPGADVRPVVRGEWETVSVPKPQTNADRIRAMTDEELAEWLAHYTSWTEFGEKMAKERWLIYLRQEVTND